MSISPLPLPTPVPTRPPARRVVRHLTLVPAPAAAPDPLPIEAPAELPVLAPQDDRAVRAVVAVLVEVVIGRRPVGQAEAIADGPVLARLVRRAAGREAAGLGLRSLRLQSPAPGVVEVALRLGDGTRSRAGALRLERRGAAWRCVALELELSPGRTPAARGR